MHVAIFYWFLSGMVHKKSLSYRPNSSNLLKVDFRKFPKSAWKRISEVNEFVSLNECIVDGRGNVNAAGVVTGKGVKRAHEHNCELVPSREKFGAA